MKNEKNADASERPLDGLVGRCGCGAEARYMTPSGDSCNRYRRCPTYDELEYSLRAANRLLEAYRKKRSVDGLNGRKWDASEHYAAEARIEALEAPNGEGNVRPTGVNS